MKGIEVFHYGTWRPLASYGFRHPFFSLNTETIYNTWIVMAVLIALAILCRIMLTRPGSLIGYATILFGRYFKDLCQQTLNKFVYPHFSFISTLFLFILACNIGASFIPFIGEPTSDLNTTLALGIISFIYVQAYSIAQHGVLGYLHEYIAPFFIMFPLHIVGKLSSIISISFRLFGNIFGGAIIIQIYHGLKSGSLIFQTIALCSGLNILVMGFFGLFEGLIQAFVFSMLTLTYLALGLQEPEHGD